MPKKAGFPRPTLSLSGRPAQATLWWIRSLLWEKPLFLNEGWWEGEDGGQGSSWLVASFASWRVQGRERPEAAKDTQLGASGSREQGSDLSWHREGDIPHVRLSPVA